MSVSAFVLLWCGKKCLLQADLLVLYSVAYSREHFLMGTQHVTHTKHKTSHNADQVQSSTNKQS